MRTTGSKNVILLALSQAIGSSGPAMVVFVGGILGANLAPSRTLSTLPISSAVVGIALTTIPAAMLMRKIGRRKGYMSGSMIGLLGSLLAAYAALQSNFLLLCRTKSPSRGFL